MRRKNRRLLIAGGLALCSAALIVVFVAFATTSAAPVASVTPTLPVHPPGSAAPTGDLKILPDGRSSDPRLWTPAPPLPYIGSSAIAPKIVVTDPAVPAFTAQEVAAYIAANPYMIKINSTTPVTVASVEFITGQEANARVNDPGRFEATRLVCYVTLNGSFTADHPQYPPDIQTKVAAAGKTNATVPRAFRIFDAHTGNELMGGLLP